MMANLICFKEDDWNYFCTKINWGASWLDGKAIQIMNEPIRKRDDGKKD
jgi:hypothetical protein